MPLSNSAGIDLTSPSMFTAHSHQGQRDQKFTIQRHKTPIYSMHWKNLYEHMA